MEEFGGHNPGNPAPSGRQPILSCELAKETERFTISSCTVGRGSEPVPSDGTTSRRLSAMLMVDVH